MLEQHYDFDVPPTQPPRLSAQQLEPGYTDLHVSAEEGDVDTVSLLLAQHADISARTSSGWSPLHCAAFRGQSGVVQLLVRAGANIQAAANDGVLPAEAAAMGGFGNIVEDIVGLQVGIFGICAYALKHGCPHLLHYEMEKQFENIKQGELDFYDASTAVEKYFYEGYDVWNVVIEAGHTETMMVLLEFASEHEYGHVFRKVLTEPSVFEAAAEHGRLAILERILENFDYCFGLDDLSGQTLSLGMLAAERGSHFDVLVYLWNALVDENDTLALAGATAVLVQAAMSGHLSMVQLLAPHFDDDTIINDVKLCPILEAGSGCREVFLWLLGEKERRKARCAANGDGRWALVIACRIGSYGMMALLQDHGAEFTSDTVVAALRGALAAGHLDMAKVLVQQYQANISAVRVNTVLEPLGGDEWTVAALRFLLVERNARAPSKAAKEALSQECRTVLRSAPAYPSLHSLPASLIPILITYGGLSDVTWSGDLLRYSFSCRDEARDVTVNTCSRLGGRVCVLGEAQKLMTHLWGIGPAYWYWGLASGSISTVPLTQLVPELHSSVYLAPTVERMANVRVLALLRRRQRKHYSKCSTDDDAAQEMGMGWDGEQVREAARPNSVTLRRRRRRRKRILLRHERS